MPLPHPGDEAKPMPAMASKARGHEEAVVIG